MERLVAELRPHLSACAECPVNGTCVYVTPAYAPGYCLHELKLAHAFMARRPREHPSAGVPIQEIRRLLEQARREDAIDETIGNRYAESPRESSSQATLGFFAL